MVKSLSWSIVLFARLLASVLIVASLQSLVRMSSGGDLRVVTFWAGGNQRNTSAADRRYSRVARRVFRDYQIRNADQHLIIWQAERNVQTVLSQGVLANRPSSSSSESSASVRRKDAHRLDSQVLLSPAFDKLRKHNKLGSEDACG